MFCLLKEMSTPTWTLLTQRGYATILPEWQRHVILNLVHKECGYNPSMFTVLLNAIDQQITPKLKKNLKDDHDWLRAVPTE